MEITQNTHPFNYNIPTDDIHYEYTSNNILEIYKKTINPNINISYENFYNQCKYINQYGSISPHGFIYETPELINLPLKLHQKRTLYHMEYLENLPYRINDENVLILSDNVGSGKSYCILSLIAKNRTTNIYPNKFHINSLYDDDRNQIYGMILHPQCIQFKTNLIVVPHSIYPQWNKYINTYTNIPYIGISCIIDIAKLGNNKDDIINTINNNHIILIKSTVYNEFINYLSRFDITQQINYNRVEFDYTIEDCKENEYIIENNIVKLKTNRIGKKRFIDNIHESYEKLMINLHDNSTNIKDTFKNYLENINNTYTLYTQNKENNEDIRECNTVKIVKGFIFERVIFDEADTIKIPSCSHYFAKKNWLITSSFMSLLYYNGGSVYDNQSGSVINFSSGMNGCVLLRDVMNRIAAYHSPYKRNRVFSTIVRNHPEFVKLSIGIPNPIVSNIRCLTPLSYNAVKNVLDNDIMRALNAGDIKQASQLLGYEIYSEEDIILSVTKSLEDKKKELLINKNTKNHELNNLVIEQNSSKNEYENAKEMYKHVSTENRPIEFEEVKKTYYNICSRINYIEKTIENNENEIKSVESKIKNIKDRLENPTAKTCSICLDNIKIPSIVTCCKNIFCIECIKDCVKTNKSCPLCRTKIDNSQIHIIKDDIQNDEDEKNNEILLDKLDILSDYLLLNPYKRILIFSEYEQTFELIQRRLLQLGIRYDRIFGSTNQINKTIENYSTNKIQVLMLNAKHFGAGINLQMTDDIFVYHRMSSDLEKQVIGRAQRLGRNEPLNIHYLCYDNEYNTGLFNENISRPT
jgi:hypothetical protein